MSKIPQQFTINQYVADGVQTNYIVSFYTPLDASNSNQPEIDVYVTLSGNQPNPIADLKVWGVDYTYTPNSPDPTTGGNIVFLAGHIPPLSSIVTLSRDVQATLTAEFSNVQNFNGVTLDNVLFQLLLIEQQNKTYALQRNLSYIVNTFFPNDDVMTANTQIPILGLNQIWKGTGSGVGAFTLEENPDVSTLRSELLNNQPGTDGSLIVGYYDDLGVVSTTVHNQLDFLTGNLRLFGTDGGSVNALLLSLPDNVATYFPGMEVKIIVSHTNTIASPTLNINSMGAKNIYRNNSTPAQIQDLIAGNMYVLTYDGTKFIMNGGNSIQSGIFEDFGGGSAPVGFLLCDGSVISQTDYPALYAAIGSTWNTGGEGAGNFRLPSSPRRTRIGSGGSASPVISNTTGSIGGLEKDNITTGHMPPHNHPGSTLTRQTGLGAGFAGSGSSGSTESSPLNIASEGNGDAFSIMQPSMVVTSCIKI